MLKSMFLQGTYAYVANNPVMRFDVDGRWFNEDGTINTSGRTPNFTTGKQYRDSFLGVNKNDGGGGGISQELLDRMLALGGDWYNAGYGFESSDHIALGYNGSYLSLNTLIDGFIDIPEVVLTGSSSGWGSQIFGHVKSFMDNWYSPGGKLNWFVSSAATALENTAGSFRITNGDYNGSSFSPKYYQSAWTGGSRARITTYNISKIGGFVGKASFGAAVVMDGVGVYNYYRNPDSNNKIHPAKFGVNTAIGLYSLKINPAAGIIYFGIDAFYPGGWTGDEKHPGAIKDIDRRQAEFDAIFKNSDMPRQYIFPYGSQKF
ncbi:hypothetical protein SAMN05216273_11486 [Chryseobacterium taihuense]|uniref:RHS repeat-associated core domain-containing protein n=2 Tax=Chryseobacterium taihuense TaxID=1141221 RepID=A0ABY0QZ54_9FLAO|nr:hypothetical protein SAMN05216273_11486 [Chryseobacterium taihuense]